MIELDNVIPLATSTLGVNDSYAWRDKSNQQIVNDIVAFANAICAQSHAQTTDWQTYLVPDCDYIDKGFCAYINLPQHLLEFVMITPFMVDSGRSILEVAQHSPRLATPCKIQACDHALAGILTSDNMAIGYMARRAKDTITIARSPLFIMAV